MLDHYRFNPTVSKAISRLITNNNIIEFNLYRVTKTGIYFNLDALRIIKKSGNNVIIDYPCVTTLNSKREFDYYVTHGKFEGEDKVDRPNLIVLIDSHFWKWAETLPNETLLPKGHR